VNKISFHIMLIFINIDVIDVYCVVQGVKGVKRSFWDDNSHKSAA